MDNARILYVEDSPVMQETMRILLESRGHKIVESTGKLALVGEALQRAIDRGEGPDLVFTDDDLEGTPRAGSRVVQIVREKLPDVPIGGFSTFGQIDGVTKNFEKGTDPRNIYSWIDSLPQPELPPAS